MHDTPHFPAIFITERKTKSFTLEIPWKFGNVCSASKPKGFFELFPFDISSSHRVYDFRKTCLPHHQECYENTLGLDTQYNQCFTDIVLLCFINCSFLPVFFSLYTGQIALESTELIFCEARKVIREIGLVLKIVKRTRRNNYKTVCCLKLFKILDIWNYWMLYRIFVDEKFESLFIITLSLLKSLKRFYYIYTKAQNNGQWPVTCILTPGTINVICQFVTIFLVCES